jgi:aspartyl aminopeptidase
VERINEALNISRTEYMQRLASSFIMSVDNAHATHPNYVGKADITNRPRLNGGVVLKFNASARYTTDAVSAAVVRAIAKRADIPVQEYHNRSDIAGGSTLGNLMNRSISVMSADIGLAQLAMHSAYETAGVKDAEYMESFLTEFYKTTIKASRDGKIEFIK